MRPAVEPESRHVLLRQRRFHYLDWSGSADTPVVFLHGAGLNARTWRGVCAQFSDRYRCYALDLRGHGDSEWANDLDYAPRTHAADVAAFVADLALDRPVLVGMSLGGTVALAHAQAHEVRALVVIDTGPVLQLTGREQLVDFFDGPTELESLEDFVELAKSINPRRKLAQLRESIRHNVIRLPDGRWTWKYDRRHYRYVSGEQRDQARKEVWSAVGRVTCPVLVVRGARSQVLSHSSATAVAASFPDGRLVEVAGAGHTVQSDRPTALASAIASFLDNGDGG